MRVAAPVELSPEQRTALERMARQRSLRVRLVERTRIVLLAAEGLENNQIARRMHITPEKVARWRSRFLAGGITALEKDAPRPGKPRTITNREVKKVVEMTLHEKPTNATHWSTRTMARAVGISEASVRRIWRAHGLKPHRVRTFKLSRDPELFAALNALEGEVISMCDDQHRHQEWLKFLRVIDDIVPPEKQIHMIVDNYATHKHPKVERWLSRHPRFHMHFTPTSCSWLNMVERFFRDLTENRLRRGIFRSVEELIEAIGQYIDHHNEHPKPFIWSAKAADILEKVKRARTALHNRQSV
jgi:transposase